MTTNAIHNRNNDLPWAPKLGRLLGVIAGSAFSPVFPLLKWALLPTLDVNHLLASGLTPNGLPNMVYQLEALGGKVLLLQIFPILVAGTLLAFLWLALCGQLGASLLSMLSASLTKPQNNPSASS